MKITSTLPALVFASILVTLVSCGSSESGGSSKKAPVILPVVQTEEDDQGIYRVQLNPMNTSVAGETSGVMEIRIEGDDVIVKGRIQGAPAGVKHLQNIMLNSTCPDLNHDTNNDGLIDSRELLAVSGEILIPLDSKISNQFEGIDYGPIANAAGSYFYQRSGSLTEILMDLRSEDPDKFDFISKLPFGDRLNLSKKVVVIHGVRAGEAMVDSLSSIRDLPPHQTLPIACGKLVRVSEEDLSEI